MKLLKLRFFHFKTARRSDRSQQKYGSWGYPRLGCCTRPTKVKQWAAVSRSAILPVGGCLVIRLAACCTLSVTFAPAGGKFLLCPRAPPDLKSGGGHENRARWCRRAAVSAFSVDTGGHLY